MAEKPAIFGAEVHRLLHHLLRKLQHFTALSDDDRRRIEAQPWEVRSFGTHAELAREGSEPRCVNVLLEGWACRYKHLEDGRRQIVALLLPGDMCDPCVFLLDEMSHGLATLTRCTVARLSERDMSGLLTASLSLSKAFWLEMLVGAEVQREWTVNLGRRTATERMAHLFCEILVRMQAVGLAGPSSCEMPITQADLGDMLGLSSVHVNRTLQQLRAMKLIELRDRRLIAADTAALQDLALFNPSYLHLQRPV